MNDALVTAARVPLPSHSEAINALIACERAEGWMERCEAAGLYLVPTVALAEALRDVLVSLDATPVLEVCAGDGYLAAALRRLGLAMIATDASPGKAHRGIVERLSAAEALRRYSARVTLGSFVPASVNRQILDDPNVEHYVVLTGGIEASASSCLWTRVGWVRTPLPEVTRWMVSRHDVWFGDDIPISHQGEAWLLSRIEPSCRKRTSGR